MNTDRGRVVRWEWLQQSCQHERQCSWNTFNLATSIILFLGNQYFPLAQYLTRWSKLCSEVLCSCVRVTSVLFSTRWETESSQPVKSQTEAKGGDPQDPGPGRLALKQKTTLSLKTASSHSQLCLMLITTDKILLDLNHAGQNREV